MRDADTSHTWTRFGFAALLLAVTALSAGTPQAQTKVYPLPKAKPQMPARTTPGYPLPRPNPRRDSTPERTPKTDRWVKPGGRAAEATDADRAPGGNSNGRWGARQVAEARKRCRQILKGVKLTYTEADPIGAPNDCGIAAPIKVTAFGGKNQVAVSPPATINCTIAAHTAKWLDKFVQPAAIREFGEPVAKIRNAASYACRRRNNSKTGRLSEHALGNAIDISSFELQSGKTVTVLKGWKTQKTESVIEEVVSAVVERETPASRFLASSHQGACKIFSTILGPDADKYHVDHFHFDYGRGGRYLICR